MEIKKLLLLLLSAMWVSIGYSQMITHDPTNMANNIIMQAESMEEAVEQKLIAQQQLVQFTAQLEMMKDKAETFKKIAGIIATSVEFIEAIEYGTNAFEKITNLRENITNYEDLTFEDKYMCIMTLVDCGYVITQNVKGLTKMREELKDNNGNGAEINTFMIQQQIKIVKNEIMEQVVRAICCVDDFIFNSQMQRANYDLYCAGLCMGQAKKYWKNGKAIPTQSRKVSIKMPNGKTISYIKPYYK